MCWNPALMRRGWRLHGRAMAEVKLICRNCGRPFTPIGGKNSPPWCWLPECQRKARELEKKDDTRRRRR